MWLAANQNVVALDDGMATKNLLNMKNRNIPFLTHSLTMTYHMLI